MREIRGLTLRPPHAWGYLHGQDVESRDWSARLQHDWHVAALRGQFLALHGGAGQALAGPAAGGELDHIEAVLDDWLTRGLVRPEQLPAGPAGHWPDPHGARLARLAPLMPGGIVAVGFVRRVGSSSDSPWARPPESGRLGLYLDLAVTPLACPVPARGQPGLWTLPPETLAEVRSAYRATRRNEAA